MKYKTIDDALGKLLPGEPYAIFLSRYGFAAVGAVSCYRQKLENENINPKGLDELERCLKDWHKDKMIERRKREMDKENPMDEPITDLLDSKFSLKEMPENGEPFFFIRGKDVIASILLTQLSCNAKRIGFDIIEREAIQKTKEFVEWQKDNIEQVKKPD